MPLNEPRIYSQKPKWAGLKEVLRCETSVKFKTRTGYIVAPLRDVEKYNKEK